MTLHEKINRIIMVSVLTVFLVACDETPQTPNSSTIDQQSLSYAYFINDGTDLQPTHLNISDLLAVSCASNSTCHRVGDGNGGTFKLYNPADTAAKNISNFISAQGHVIKGPEDTSPTVTTNNYPLAHTSPLLQKPLSTLAGGTTHKGNNSGDLFTAPSELLGNGYGEIYRWIAFTPP